MMKTAAPASSLAMPMISSNPNRPCVLVGMAIAAALLASCTTEHQEYAGSQRAPERVSTLDIGPGSAVSIMEIDGKYPYHLGDHMNVLLGETNHYDLLAGFHTVQLGTFGERIGRQNIIYVMNARVAMAAGRHYRFDFDADKHRIIFEEIIAPSPGSTQDGSAPQMEASIKPLRAFTVYTKDTAPAVVLSATPVMETNAAAQIPVDTPALDLRASTGNAAAAPDNSLPTTAMRYDQWEKPKQPN